MSKPNTRRVILRAAQFAMASGGICLFLSLPASQARAATGGQPQPLSGLTGAVGSIVNAVTGGVASAAPAVAQTSVSAEQATPTASATSPGQALPAGTATATVPGATATSHPSAPVTAMAMPAASETAKASAPITTEPTPVVPTPPVKPAATQVHSPLADILPPIGAMPRWLEDVLLAAGLLVATAFAAEPVAALARHRQRGDQPPTRRR